MKKFILFSFFCILSLLIPAQSQKIDQLKDSLALSIDDSVKSYLLQKIGNEYYAQNEYPNAIEQYKNSIQLIKPYLKTRKASRYHKIYLSTLIRLGDIYNTSKKDSLALDSYMQAHDFAAATGNFKFISNALNALGFFYESKEKFSKAYTYYREAYNLDSLSNDQQNIAHSASNLGTIYTCLNQYNKSIHYFMESIRIYEEDKNEALLSRIYNNLGVTYLYIKDMDKALKFYQKAMDIDLKNNNLYGLSIDYSNIGNVYQEKKDFVQAQAYYFKALELDKQRKDTFGMAADYGNLALSYLQIKNIPQALEYNAKALSYFNLLGLNNELAITHEIYAEIFLEQGNYSRALTNAYKAIEYATKINSIEELKNSYELLYKIYKAKNKYKEAFLYQEKFYQLKDSLLSMEKLELIKNMEFKYQTEKKDQFILNTQEELVEKDSLLDKRKVQLIILSVFVLLVLLSSFIAIHAYLNKRKINKTLKIQSAEILAKNNELNQQNHEILAQRDEIQQQKHQLETKNSFLTDSIEYAEKIQSAVLPPIKIVNELFPENVIFYEPRNIVSGDFFWVAQQNHLSYLAVADCTGHGVPGAFMSMLGITFLNEILNSYIITNADDCLNYLKTKVISSLHQSGEIGESKDGLDIGFCIIDRDDQQISYAGAHIPLVIVRNQQLLFFKADPRPIGIYSKFDNYLFKQHVIDYQKGDVLYMFSDGIIDQFGGEKNKKFKKSRLKKLLVEIAQKPMDEQKQILYNVFHDWKGNNDHIDDVLVMGVRL